MAALQLADAMSTTPVELSDELVVELRAHFDETQLAELIVVCGQANLNNRVGNAAKRALGPDDTSRPDR